MKTEKGIITSIVTEKGYGFITKENTELIFFHAIGVCSPKFEELKEGNKVEYMVKDTPKGPKAIGVVVI